MKLKHYLEKLRDYYFYTDLFEKNPSEQDKKEIGVVLSTLVILRLIYKLFDEFSLNALDLVLIYFVGVFLLWTIGRFSIINKIVFILAIPIKIVIFIFVNLTGVLREITIYLLINLSVFLLLIGIQILIQFNLTSSSELYLALTISSIVITFLSDNIIKATFVERQLSSEKFLFSLNGEKIRKLIFLVYFILLLIANIANFNSNNFYDTIDLLPAILQSFVTFIAFDRIITSTDLIKSFQ